jgi:GNAT superfamily N-acetyltransferase
MKRLYVRPALQGLGLGRLLCSEALRVAKDLGYRDMVLDTLDRLAAASAMYAKLGFSKCQPYYHNPHEGVLYWRKEL